MAKENLVDSFYTLGLDTVGDKAGYKKIAHLESERRLQSFILRMCLAKRSVHWPKNACLQTAESYT